MSEVQEITEKMGIHKQWYDEAEKITPESLQDFITKLSTGYKHDYGTICHAVAAAGIAAMKAVNRSPQGGISGFQAGCIIWEVIRHWGTFGDGPKRMICYKDMLYPQYKRKFTNTIDRSTWEYLQKEAKKNLEKDAGSTEVKAHWLAISEGNVPFGYAVTEDDL